MKKNTLKIALIAIITIFSFEKTKAQENQFILSSSDTKNDKSFDVFGFDNNSFYTYYNTIDETILFESFSINDLKSTVKTKIELPKIDGKKVKFEQIIYIKNHIYLFTSLYDKKNKINTAYVNEITSNGIINSESIKIDEILDSKDRNLGFLSFSLSTDSSSILVFKIHDENIADEVRGLISYKILDSKLKTKYNNKIELEKTAIHYNITDVMLDNNQNLYYLQNEPAHNKEVNDYRMKYNVCLYNAKDEKLYKTEINIEENHMLDSKLSFASSGHLICTGNYATEKMFGGDWMRIKCLKGVFYVELNENNLSIISKNKKNIQETLADSKLYRYNLLDVFTLKSNQLIIICEFQNTLLTSGVGSSYNTYETTFGSLIITSFDLNNKNESWVSYFDKDKGKNTKQCKEGSERHRVFKNDNSFKLLYNCNRQIYFDEKGSITDKSIFEDSQNFNESFINSCFQTNNNTIISGTISKENGRGYAKIVFK